MNEMAVTLLGAAGTTLSVVSLIPQVLKTWRTRHADDISAGWLVLALVSMVVWVAYGSLAGAPAIAWANGLTFVQIAYILAVKCGYGRKLASGPGHQES
ncbi:MAG TPA: SemiSWEET family transporter [Alphaproteobacteria bacterium]|nr:SemiSWEET family transporter [Alphaproteobacteria bacterium]